MSAILALLTALIIIAIAMLRRKEAVRPQSAVILKRYLHPAHTWLKQTDDGEVLVGIDDFAQALIGRIDDIELPHLLHSVHQGEIVMHLKHGDKVAAMVSPVSGRVIEKNEMVLRSPDLINASPYGDGWLYKVHPRRLVPQLRNLIVGKRAHVWQDFSRAQIARVFSGAPGLVYQDGGVMVDNLADRCTPELWERISQEFFLVDERGDERSGSRQ
jgi:glycine cleavage system H protein